jgi:hypothetical protein
VDGEHFTYLAEMWPSSAPTESEFAGKCGARPESGTRSGPVPGLSENARCVPTDDPSHPVARAHP